MAWESVSRIWRASISTMPLAAPETFSATWIAAWRARPWLPPSAAFMIASHRLSSSSSKSPLARALASSGPVGAPNNRPNSDSRSASLGRWFRPCQKRSIAGAASPMSPSSAPVRISRVKSSAAWIRPAISSVEAR